MNLNKYITINGYRMGKCDNCGSICIREVVLKTASGHKIYGCPACRGRLGVRLLPRRGRHDNHGRAGGSR